MSRIRQLLEYGASFGAGVAAGWILLTDEENYEEDVWTGREHTIELTYNEARERLVEIHGWLGYDWDDHNPEVRENPPRTISSDSNPFMERDLKNLRRKFHHALSDKESGDAVQVMMNDRERLLIFDLVFSGPSITEIQEIGRDELSWDA